MREDGRVSIILEEIIEIGAPSDAERLSEEAIKPGACARKYTTRVRRVLRRAHRYFYV